MHDRQLGFFKIDDKTLTSYPDKIFELFNKMKAVPVRVDYLMEYKAYKYLAISELFEDVSLGAIIPEYMIEIDKNSGSVNVIKAGT